MSAKRIELYSLPKIVVCENGEDCDTDDTHSSTTNGEEEDRGIMAEKANDQALDDATPKENPPAPKPASKPKPSKATVAEKQVEPNLRGNHEIDIKPSAKPHSKAAKAATIEETGELPSRYVGRVIGKGGEMIRDLQARSGCHIDVDQKVKRGAPKNITYRGQKREDIDFAKHLVAMLCTEDAPDKADLPLGHAMVRQILVPDADVGRIIGRRGEMIRELQTRSQARIQVDHSKDHGGDGAGANTKHRQVTITGTKDSVEKAEEMISLLSTNPHMDGHELLESVENWSGGDAHPDGSSHQHRGYDDGCGSRQGSWNTIPYAYSPPAIMETEILPCEEADIGHIIGRRGATVIDLRRRSNCDIQIDPQRRRIIITGPRQGIETAKRMLRNVLERGSNHPYAGGRRLERQGERSVLGCQEAQQGYSPCYAEQPMVPYQQQQPFAIPQAPRRYSAPAPSPWRAAVAMDGRVYYYNQETLETRWEKPAEMR